MEAERSDVAEETGRAADALVDRLEACDDAVGGTCGCGCSSDCELPTTTSCESAMRCVAWSSSWSSRSHDSSVSGLPHSSDSVTTVALGTCFSGVIAYWSVLALGTAPVLGAMLLLLLVVVVDELGTRERCSGGGVTAAVTATAADAMRSCTIGTRGGGVTVTGVRCSGLVPGRPLPSCDEYFSSI